VWVELQLIFVGSNCCTSTRSCKRAAVFWHERRRSGIQRSIDFSQTPEPDADPSTEAKIEALAAIICRAGDKPAAALFVIMGTLEHSTQPKLLANAAKHFAFTCCGESNLYGIVDAQIAVVEGELLSNEHI